MQTFYQFLGFLNIKPGEARIIGLSMLLGFLLELAFVFIQSMAFGVFLAEYGSQSLPYSYVTVAIFGSLTALLYIRLGERVSFSSGLILNLTFLSIFNFVVWVGLKSPLSHHVSFILPLLYQISMNLGYLALWQLAGRLFNFQQGKRLFPLLIAGQWLANIFGGLLVQPLVGWVGPTNLLLPAIAILGFVILNVRAIMRTYLADASAASESRSRVGAVKTAGGFFRSGYARLIFAFVTVWWIAFYFLDTIFANRVAAQFPDAGQLTAFMGRLLSMTGFVALVSATLLTSRIIRRFGLRAGLLGESVPVTVLLGLLVIVASFNGSFTLVFFLTVFAKLSNVALGFSLSQTAYTLLYQALPDTVRARVQATADGIGQPIASGLAGLSLILLITELNFNYLQLSFIYLSIATGLLIIIFLLSREYLQALTYAIMKRRLGESPLILADPASVALLKTRLLDSHPGVAMYALTKLDGLAAPLVVEALPALIQHPAPEIRREAFVRVEKLRRRAASEAVIRQLHTETVPSAREAGLRALGAIADPEACTQLLNELEQPESHVLRGALIGLLKYQHIPAAEHAVHRLLVSPSSTDRILAAQTLGEVGQSRFQQMHEALLLDPDLAVRRAALQSAAKSRLPGLYPFLVQACDFPDTSRAAASALIDLGSDALPAVETAFSQPDAPRQRLMALAKVLGCIGGTRAHRLLSSRMTSPDAELRSEALSALNDAGYHTEDFTQSFSMITMEARGVAWLATARAELGNTDKTALLVTALQQSIAQARDRVLLLLSFAFEAKSLLLAREALLAGSTSQLTYALEIIDTQLPPEWKAMVMPVLDNLSSQDQVDQLALVFPQAPQSRSERLRTLIVGSETERFADWVRACAIFTAVQLQDRSCYDVIHATTADSSGRVRDTACWAVGQLAPDAGKGNAFMLSTIEKVLILKTVDMFSQTPDNVLADIADLLQEVDVPAGETVFHQGDFGDSMYIIVDGKVRVHTEEQLLNYLGESDVFGEMALLDPKPRLASVTAVEPTRLFRLDQSPFYQLMAERPEVAIGVIRVLTRLLRDRVHDLSRLQGRVEELGHIQPK